MPATRIQLKVMPALPAEPAPAEVRPVRWRGVAARIPPLIYAAPALIAVLASLFVWPPSSWPSVLVVIALIALAQLGTVVGVSLDSGRIAADFPLLIVLAAVAPPSAVILGAAFVTVSENLLSRSASLDRLYINFSALVLPMGIAAGMCTLALNLGVPAASAEYALVVLGSFCTALFLNFFIAFAPDLDDDQKTMRELSNELLLPLAPHHLMLGVVASGITIAYGSLGASVVALGAVAVLGFGWIVGELMASRKRMRDLEHFSISTLHTLLRSISLRDKMTARHSAAVARYAQLIALETGKDADWVQSVVKPAGVLHDVGKHLFPDSILKGENRLTDQEFEIVKQHPVAGWELIRKLPGYEEIATIVRHHHERIDGRGYPDGLSGDEIPFASRCIAVADTFDVMTSRDTYRKPVPVCEAVDELLRVSGTQLDPECVQAFVRVLQQQPYEQELKSISDRDLLSSLQEDIRLEAEAA